MINLIFIDIIYRYLIPEHSLLVVTLEIFRLFIMQFNGFSENDSVNGR